MLHLLPAQILLAMVGSVNGMISTYFASNFVGVEAMSAVGLYAPIQMLFSAIFTMLSGGSVILCGKYLGRNEHDRLHNNFSVNIIITVCISVFFILLFLAAGLFDLTSFLTSDALVKHYLNRYILGQAVGILPLLLGNLLTAFLSVENRSRRTVFASLVYILVNVLLNFIFVKTLRMEAFGLALASSLGLWVFLAIEAAFFISGKSIFCFRLRNLDFKESRRILSIGFPGAASNGYQTIRGIVLNLMLTASVGSIGISAFAAADNLLRIFWSIPIGMLAVSRMMISVSIGEEDRKTLTDIMRVMFRRFLPVMCLVSVLLIAFAVPITYIFYHDPCEPVFMMTVWALRILPMAMPLSIIMMHFVCYGQASGKNGLVHILSLLDGVVCVVGFSAFLIPRFGTTGACIANVLNGVVTTLVIVLYSAFNNRHMPRNMDELMVVPNDFGASEENRMDISIENMDEVVSISQRVQHFCLDKGIDGKRAYLSALALEEMAGNIVEHGFTKDRRSHSIDIRVVHKDDNVILRIRDDCIPFDPISRHKLVTNEDKTRNIGLRVVFRISKDIQYQNILGMNVLTMRI